MLKAAKKELADAEKQIRILLDRIIAAEHPGVIAAYTERLAKLETEKAIMIEKIENTDKKPARFEELFELSMKFLANPCKLWESGRFSLKRIVLKLAFADHLVYDPKTGVRTPALALPFKALTANSDGIYEMAHPRGFEPLTL
jgi:site-specific DNA recombinase